MEIRFDGKVVVIIGASGGIGKATAKEFALSGGTVIAAGMEPPDEIDTEELGCMEYVQLDVTKEEEIEAFAVHVQEKYGGCDVLHNNAGILIPHMLHLCTTEEYDRTMAVNARGVYLCSRYFIKQMMEKGGGSIVNTCSMSGLLADPNYFSYNASKGAVANMTRNMAIDYAPYNIRVNAVDPGSVKTEMHFRSAELVGGLDVLDYGVGDIYPIGRNGYPEEIASCVLFLASDRASFVTGHNLVADGGLTAGTGAAPERQWLRLIKEYHEKFDELNSME